MNIVTGNKFQTALEKSTELFVERATLQYEINRCSGFQVTLVACLIAWISVYLTEAIKSDELIFVIMAVVGLMVLFTGACLYYRKGRVASQEVARIEAMLFLEDKLKDSL
ncbi:hypothetical protein [Vibrio parahaemolyticus]|uniref:hypothetical protein n=1 Tax=Vibrio parahaemolyticus TaxID=670 RepID=UPI0005F19E17|nr:hypothetical protein [Vibrio parahaemolyticus]HCZ9539725.1 hypothetical protein [Vibrio alginolyticus]EHK0045368.1 hypothetical protein [Vibrio parahaemolyticus]EIU7880245.1 hypothetical protein [Vibrio parahaemolyticus]MCQ9057211.1 hypothetical protein [Vibrio parahaemolyticus]OQK27161.1 putative membrane protein [Vibrio parahaemolyticus]